MNKQQEEVLTSAYSYVNKLLQKLDELIENIADKPNEYLDVLTDGLDGIKWLADALAVTHDLHGYAPDYDFLTEQFSTILEGYENHDFAFIAEVFENEIMPLLCDWLDVIEETLETLETEEEN